jgi:hypothetical protein
MTFSLPRYAAYIAAWVAHAKSYANLGAPDLPALRNASKALAATFTPSWQEFYAGHWRSTANGQPAPLASGDVLPIPGAATHAFMGVNSGLLRRHPEYAYPRLTEDSAPCPHANCPECNTARMIFVGFAFKVGEDFLTVILDPRGTRPPLRLVWKSGEFLPATKRFGVRDTPKQRRRDSRHVTRMRALRDPIISAALAAANVTLTRRKPVPTRT